MEDTNLLANAAEHIASMTYFLFISCPRAILDFSLHLFISRKGKDTMLDGQPTRVTRKATAASPLVPKPLAASGDKIEQVTHSLKEAMLVARSQIRESCNGFCRKHKSSNDTPSA